MIDQGLFALGGEIVKVEQLMTRAVAAVHAETPLKDVAEILAKRDISGVPVVDDDRHVLGVVSEGDIVAKESGPRLGRIGFLELIRNVDSAWLEQRLSARTAADAMTSPALTVYAHAPVADAAALMTERGVNRLPVLDRDEKLAGILTRADMVRAFLRSDAEIEHEIEHDVLLETFWIEPRTIDINSDHGEVRLAGEVDTKEMAYLLEAFVKRVPGVVGVRSSLSWRDDGVETAHSEDN